MNHPHRFVISHLFGSLAFGATLFAASVAPGAPTPADNGEATTLESKLAAVLGRPGGLTSNVVAARAESTSFDVKARQSELESAAAGVDQALVGYFPRLTATGRYTRLSSIDQASLGNLIVAPNAPPGPVPPGSQLVSVPLSFPVILNQYVLQATLTVPISDYVLRIPESYAAATKSQRAAVLTEKATRLKTAMEARIAYYTWVRAKLQEVVAEQSPLQAKAHLVDAQHAFDAGAVSKADVLRIESQVASSRLLFERAASFERTAESQLRVMMHDVEASRYEVGESIAPEPNESPAGEGLVSMWSEASSRRLEVRALEDSAGSFREQAKVARAGYLPRLDGFGNLTYANPNQRIFPAQDAFKTTWDAGLQVSWSPNDLGNSAASSRSLEARAASLAAQRQALEDGIRIEITQANNGLREAEAAIESTAQGLAAAEESYRVRRSLFKNGRATAVELTDAETDLTRSRLESINARVDRRIAEVRLEHATGRDTAGQ